MRRYLLMEVEPATHARPDMRRRLYPLAEPVDEEVVDELSPAANPYTAVWTPPHGSHVARYSAVNESNGMWVLDIVRDRVAEWSQASRETASGVELYFVPPNHYQGSHD